MRFIRWVLLSLLLTSVGLAQEVVTTTIIAEGSGNAAEMGQTVAVSYKLFHKDGALLEEFPETKPLTFKLGSDEVPSGFSLGIEGMKVQEVRKVEIPPAFGYGDESTLDITPDTTLVLEAKLLRIGDTATSSDKDDEPLSEKYKDDQYLSKRHARNIKKPAIFEYLIRDFNTKPWRYEDSYRNILLDCLKLVMLFGGLAAVYGFGLWKGWVRP